MPKYHNIRYLFRLYEIMRMVRKARSFFEVGPGDLSLAQELLSKFETGTLMDFNTSRVQELYDRLPAESRARLHLLIADFTEYTEPGAAYDCLVACEVLEHIEDDQAFLRKMCELLTARGQLLLSVPARQKYWAADDEIVGHYRRYERDDLRRKLLEAGFRDIEIVSYGFPFQNIVRLGRIAVAKLQYNRKKSWDQKNRSQESAFLIGRGRPLNWIGLFINKYTLYPFNLISSLFGQLDEAEGYVVSAVKASAAG